MPTAVGITNDELAGSLNSCTNGDPSSYMQGDPGGAVQIEIIFKSV
jgi:hypothetical protein